MKAVTFSKFGTAKEVLQITEVEKPTPKHGEVLVKIHTSAVNPSDVKKRAGSFPALLDNGFVIPNSDGAGTIEAVGQGVSAARIGERVWLYQAQFGRLHGTTAEYISVDSHRAIVLPENTSFEVGACLGIPAMTAHRCVFGDGDVEGKSIVITGGAGRVGFYAIQWAKMGGAYVIATASNAKDVETCNKAGADAVVNHRLDNFSDLILSANNDEQVDRVIDVEFGANLDTMLKVVKVGATISTYSSMQNKNPEIPFFQMMYQDLTLHFVIVYAMPEEAKIQAIEDIAFALKENKLIHRIAEVVPFNEPSKAHELIEEGNSRGGVIIQL